MILSTFSPAESSENRAAAFGDNHICSAACKEKPEACCRHTYSRPLVRQALAVAGMSVGCILDGVVIAYSSPAIPSLLAKSSSIQIDHHQASWIGKLFPS